MQNFQQQYAPHGFRGQQQQESQRIENPGQKRSQSFEDQMLTFIGENKRLLNIHEQKFVELATFQANTNVFQANTKASKKYGDTSRAVGPSNEELVQGCLSQVIQRRILRTAWW